MATNRKATDGLTTKQRRFVEEYLADPELNGKAAATRAGYAPGKPSEVQACRMLSLDKVKRAIAAADSKRVKRLELQGDDVLRELLRIGTSDIKDAFDEDGRLLHPSKMPEDFRRAVSSLEADEVFGEEAGLQVTTKKLRLWDKPKALELLGKRLSLWADLKIKHEHSLAELVEAALKLPPTKDDDE